MFSASFMFAFSDASTSTVRMRPSVSTRKSIFRSRLRGRFVHEVLKETGVNGVLIGRLAVWVCLSSEKKQLFTKDMDIAVTREGLHRIRKWLKDRDIRYLDSAIGGLNVERPGQISVDFITRSCDFGDFSPLFEDATQDAVENGVRIEVGKGRLTVVSPEHLSAMKIGTGEKKDEEDAEALLVDADIRVEVVRSLIATHLGPGTLSRFEVMLRKMGHPDAKAAYRLS
jgi:hypothetical protein